jgi:AcrR family transcriptional regulator
MVDHQFGPFAPANSAELARIRAALIELALENGIPKLTPEMVSERAGVDHALFESQFADVRDCSTRVYVANIAEFDRIVFDAVERAEGWPGRLRASAYAATRYIRDRPLEARFNFVEMLEGGEEAQVYRDRYVLRIVDLIDEGRAHLPDPDSHGKELAQATFGSIYEFLSRKFQQGEDGTTMERYVPELMFIAVQPYLGIEAAQEELSIPPPPEGD